MLSARSLTLVTSLLLCHHVFAQDEPSGQTNAPPQNWSFHAQNTAIVQYHPDFPAPYTGPNSLHPINEIRETVSLDLLFGARLWRGAEAHIDGLMWQGTGFANTHGIEAFPNGEAFHFGSGPPNIGIARLFIRQTIGLGGETELIEPTQLELGGKHDQRRVVLTVGEISVKDIFDNNAYANDPRTQFMSWSLMANPAWDFPANALGYMTGAAIELIEPKWAARYGFFQMPRVSNGVALDPAFLDAWGMVIELEHAHQLYGRPGKLRWLAFLNRAHMGSYAEAVDSPIRPADIEATRAYRYKYGFGLNLEQEVATNIGAFARIGWNNGQYESWTFNDVDHAATAGLSFNGTRWNRTNDVAAIAGGIEGITPIHRDFFAAGGTGILAGDGKLRYSTEQFVETYYDAALWKTLHGTIDYQFIANPAFNQDRGPVHVFSARLHWEY